MKVLQTCILVLLLLSCASVNEGTERHIAPAESLTPSIKTISDEINVVSQDLKKIITKVEGIEIELKQIEKIENDQHIIDDLRQIKLNLSLLGDLVLKFKDSSDMHQEIFSSTEENSNLILKELTSFDFIKFKDVTSKKIDKLQNSFDKFDKDFVKRTDKESEKVASYLLQCQTQLKGLQEALYSVDQKIDTFIPSGVGDEINRNLIEINRSLADWKNEFSRIVSPLSEKLNTNAGDLDTISNLSGVIKRNVEKTNNRLTEIEKDVEPNFFSDLIMSLFSSFVWDLISGGGDAGKAVDDYGFGISIIGIILGIIRGALFFLKTEKLNSKILKGFKITFYGYAFFIIAIFAYFFLISERKEEPLDIQLVVNRLENIETKMDRAYEKYSLAKFDLFSEMNLEEFIEKVEELLKHIKDSDGLPQLTQQNRTSTYRFLIEKFIYFIAILGSLMVGIYIGRNKGW